MNKKIKLPPNILMLGNLQVGKSTLARKLSTHLHYRIYSLADTLREMTCQYLFERFIYLNAQHGWLKATSTLDQYYTVFYDYIFVKNYSSFKNSTIPVYNIIYDVFPDLVKDNISMKLDRDVNLIDYYSLRELLKLFGTECCRNCLGQDVWVNAVINKINENSYVNTFCSFIIDDCRYLNEIHKMKNRFPGTVCVHISKPGSDTEHSSNQCEQLAKNNSNLVDFTLSFSEGEEKSFYKLLNFVDTKN